jgi:predicted acetyltransferase
MKRISLEQIGLKHKEEIYRIKKEYDNNKEDYNGAFFIKEFEDYDKLISGLDNYAKGIMDNPNYVPYTCYVAVTKDGQIVGLGSLRHELNDYLVKFGGHIGYSVVPSERKKGYGTRILKLLLKEAKAKGINDVLVTCSEDNIGSKKVIENNKGELEDKIEHDNKVTCRYWIRM